MFRRASCQNDTVSTIEGYQASFDLEPGYLNWAAFGPLSPTVREETVADIELLGSGRQSSIDHVAASVDRARELVAELVGGRAESVALQPSTTQGLMQAVFGVTGGILLSRNEFPSLPIAATRAEAALGAVHPEWMEAPAGYVTPEVIADSLTPATRAVALSLVDFRTGYRADLAAIREVIGDRLLIVDAIQGFGMVEADYQAADVVAGHGFKWLRAGRGTGFSWFSDRALEELTPVFTGISGTDAEGPTDDIPPVSAGAHAFTVSPVDQIAAARLAASLTEITEVGVAAIERELADRTRDVLLLAERYGIPTLTPQEPEHRAGIVTLAPAPQDVAALAASLANSGITSTTRAGAVRLSPHVGTGADTFQLLGEALASFAQTRAW